MGYLDFIIQVEQEGFDPEDEDQRAALEGMITSGVVWNLQGFWGRLAARYIEEYGDPRTVH